MKARILIIDDEGPMRRALERLFAAQECEVLSAATATEGLQMAHACPVDVALVDLVIGDMDGVECIRQLKAFAPQTAAIVMTGFGSIASAVEAMKAGAYHYVTKPFPLEEITRIVAMALECRTLREENQQLKRQLRQQRGRSPMIGRGPEIRRVLDLVGKVAATESTVLILGESGTGKELVARAIHDQSRRADQPLVTVNCAAIPEELLETELFGHVKGAFTGATETHQGKFAAARGGTIFLDEIGDMSLKLQVKILRVLQERRFEPVGSTRSAEADVRIITATHHDLERAVKDGRFREDLYYRLNVIPVKLPPLRARRSDVPLLVQYFVREYCRANARTVEGVSDEAMRLLVRYDWPGNVRELENVVERLVILRGTGTIGVEDLAGVLSESAEGFRAPALEIPEGGLSLRHVVIAFENELILRALEKTGWNKNRAAGLLRLNRTTLVEKIKKKQLGKHGTAEGGNHVQEHESNDRG